MKYNATIRSQKMAGLCKSFLHNNIFTYVMLCPFVVLSCNLLNAQSNCQSGVGSLYSSETGNEQGTCLVANPENDGMYVVGVINDSTLIMEVDLAGEVLWSKAFDVILDNAEFPTTAIVDSEGMIAVSGVAGDISGGGHVYLMRFDPGNLQVLWSNEYLTIPTNFPYNIVQKENGNYLLNTNPHNYPNNHIDVEIFEINKNTGDLEPGFSMRYTFFGTESLAEIALEDGFVYGVGRYKDGASDSDFRHVVVKLDADDGTQIWSRFGHVPEDEPARLYGNQIVIQNGEIITGYTGDPDGISLSENELFMQKTDTNGVLIWCNQYVLDGETQTCHDMIYSDGGIVMLASHRIPEQEIVLFKVNDNGELVWSKKFLFPSLSNFVLTPRGGNRLAEIGGQLIFTATGNQDGNNTDVLIIRTDLNGNVDLPCVRSEDYNMSGIEVSNPDFYPVNPTATPFSPEVITLASIQNDVFISPEEACFVSDTIFTTLEATICEDESFEGYSQSGTYMDIFISAEGCDSIRTLILTVNVCTPECGSIVGTAYSAFAGDERGYSLASIPGDDDFFVAGGREDSVLLMRVTTNGDVEWARSFDIRPNMQDNVFSLILDSDNNLVMSGISGDPTNVSSIFVVRYDHTSHQIVWVNSIANQIRSYNFEVVEKSAGGNYVISNNPHAFSNNDAELLEIDRNTGSVVSSFAKDYDFGSSDDLIGLTVHEGFIYGTGRFTHDPSPFGMRNVLMKLDAADGTPVWAKLGHMSQDVAARLYGTDIVVNNNFIYSIYSGDPDGSSLAATEMYIQKTTLDGALVWLKHYPIQGSNDIAYDILEVNGGYVVYARSDQSANALNLFKINDDGIVLWAKRYDFPTQVPQELLSLKSSQLIQAGNKLVFTAFTTNAFGENDLLLVRTDLEGNTDIPCVNVDEITIDESDVPTPVFYDVTVNVTDEDPLEQEFNPQSEPIAISPIAECVEIDTTAILLLATICNGDIFEGYTVPGVYTDTFDIEGDCDSVRILTLTVINCQPIVYYDLDACRSFMIDGSHMDFSEFTPQYPVDLSCTDIDAGNVHMVPGPDNKHSCTPGVNGTVAMCVGVFNTCTYQPGHSASVIFEMNVNPVINGEVWVTGLEFYEKAPVNYVWIQGPTGLNNYPQFYGIRILRDGVEIYRQENVATGLNWNLEEYSFIDDSLFRFDDAGVLRFELFPYCPIGNGAEVSAWDLDEIRIFGACAPSAPIHSSVYGTVNTKQGQHVDEVKMYLGKDPLFHERVWTWSDTDGNYNFSEVTPGPGYYATGYKNDDVLNGVSTVDMLLIQKHILGVQPFISLEQYVASDINRSGHLSALDIVELRKTLLGKQNDFPDNRSWRIGSVHQDFDSKDPLSFNELSTIEYLDAAPLQLDFLGVKVGDVNGDIILNNAGTPLKNRNTAVSTLSIKDRKVEAGIPFVVEVKATEAMIVEGMQWALNVNGLDLLQIHGQKLAIDEEHFSFLGSNELRMSWSLPNGMDIRKDEVLFSIELISPFSGYLSELISINEVALTPEMYTPEDVKSIHLIFENKQGENQTEGYCLVAPNPFRGETKLRFYLPESGNARIMFYTLSGEMIHAVERTYTAGEHVETITTQQLSGATGVIVCHLLSNGFTSVQKIVHLQ